MPTLKEYCIVSMDYHQRRAKKDKVSKNRYIYVYMYEQRYAHFQNKTKLLGGLWSFEQQPDLPQMSYTKAGEVKYSYSHFNLHVVVLLVFYSETGNRDWFSYEKTKEIAMSGVDKKVLSLVEN